jgi:hypothetical protein
MFTVLDYYFYLCVALPFLLLEQGILNYSKSALFKLRRLVVQEGGEFRSGLLLGELGVGAVWVL